MNHPIYYFVAFIIGTALILLILNINFQVSDFQSEQSQENVLFLNIKTATEILDFNLKRIGYKSTQNPIDYADSSSIKFYSDIDDNNTVDSIEIKLLPTNTPTENPNDSRLVLILNSQIHDILPNGVVGFKLEYFDINNQPVTEKLFIKRIKYTVNLETISPIENKYLSMETTGFVIPKNIY